MITSRFIVLGVMGLGAAAVAQPATFSGLGDLAGGGFQSAARAVSADGAVVVGSSSSALAPSEAFRWTAATGMVGLGVLPSAFHQPWSTATSASGDGSVVVGNGNLDPKGFSFTALTSMVALPLPAPGPHSSAGAVSAAGTVIVGSGMDVQGYWTAVRWVWSGAGWTPELLGNLAGTNNCSLIAVSGDGTRAAGYCSGSTAMYWTQSSGLVPLGDLPGGSQYAEAWGLNESGTVIAGASRSSGGMEACRWTAAASWNPQGLGWLSGHNYSWAYSASNSGAVVGLSFNTSGGASTRRAFIYDPVHAMRDLRDVLVAEHGLAVALTGWVLSEARGISRDGTVIVGDGTNPQGLPEAWIARLGQTCYPNCDQSTATPILSVQDFTCFLQRYAAGHTYANCDSSTQAPVLNVQDFTCFLQRYGAGCP